MTEAFGQMPVSREPRAKRLLSYFYATACLLCAVQVTWAAHYSGVDTVRVLMIGLLLWLAYGLARLSPLAMKIAGALCLLGAVFLPSAVINPFTAGDLLAQGLEPPTISEALYWLVPTELLLLVSAYIFDRDGPADAQPGSEA